MINLMKRGKYMLGIAAVLLVMLAACEDETKTCDQTLKSDLRINFKKDSLDGYILKDTTWPKVTLCALEMDTLIKRAPRSSVFLSLSPKADSCKFYLKLDSAAVADTLFFKYKREPHFVSPGCGFATFYRLDTVITTFHTIDSIHINQKEVTSTNDTHVSLFFQY